MFCWAYQQVRRRSTSGRDFMSHRIAAALQKVDINFINLHFSNMQHIWIDDY